MPLKMCLALPMYTLMTGTWRAGSVWHDVSVSPACAMENTYVEKRRLTNRSA